ncbi:glucoamylase family protein [Moheibacter lacus]|uniref:Beta-glucosidase n=1 Tax=Moheibacter lacus TaxID=2745851 RepID=A0A838ZK29_9FLAO|nr:glucoamylase family protein [Moheibacter lacus]MBA5629598.1 beta-glucosidase [Moheibacter lacus]
MKKNFILFICFIAAMGCNRPASEASADAGSITNNDEEMLMNQVQQDVLKYFWDFAEPNSLLARERYHPDGNYPENDANVVTSGGSGFGLMTLIVGIDRNFIPREEAVLRLHHMMDFLEKADRFHGAWPHWMNGETGKVKSFGKKDNGGDLVETAFLVQGLICIKEYFKDGNESEKQLAEKADQLWKGVEWNWYTKGEEVLYWHWSPEYEWEMNFPLEGYNECLITYVLAAASPDYSIEKEVFTKGWSRSGEIKSEAKKFEIPVIVNHNGAVGSVGPLFWSQYSYLGLNPKGLSDEFVNYWDLNVNHSKIMYEYALENPKKFKGYGKDFWGLTASYTLKENGETGYTAHSPQNDNGVITPTAALSSFPYTPNESMDFLKFIYNKENKDKFIGPAGPYDAFSIEDDWVAKRFLAIDQGTIAPMIENHRTGLIWKLFMQNDDVQRGLAKLGFKVNP